MSSKRDLILLSQRFAVCKLPRDARIPDTDRSAPFWSATRSADELSIVCPMDQVPDNATIEMPWACLQVRGPLSFGLTGVLASLAQPLAKANISIFALSTFDTDYIFVKQENLDAACAVLKRHGHHIHQE